MFFTEDITLSTILCDEDDYLTLWGLARLFQDVALAHSETLGVGYYGLKSLDKAWILTHVYYNVLRLPMAGERLTLRTWAKQDNGLIAPRDYQLIDSNGVVCASSSSNWVILDTNSRKVTRLGEIIKVYDKEAVDSTKYSKLEKLKMPDVMDTLKKIDVPFSSIDHTYHVNNAEYIKWICDSIPVICKPREDKRPEISELMINYLRETKYGDANVMLLHKEQDETKYFQILNSNGVSVNAFVKL